MNLSPFLLPARVLAMSALLVATTECSVSEKVKESPSKKSMGLNGNPGTKGPGQTLAYEQMQYRLNFMDEARLADEDILFVRQATDLTSPQQAKLQTALQSGNLPLHLRMRVFARNPSSETVQLRQLNYQLLLDGRELTSGITGVDALLESSAIVTLPVVVDLNVPRERMNGSTPAAFATGLTDFTGSTRRLTMRIRPTYLNEAGSVSPPTEFKSIDLVTVKR